jgi:hypothetical protein
MERENAGDPAASSHCQERFDGTRAVGETHVDEEPGRG